MRNGKQRMYSRKLVRLQEHGAVQNLTFSGESDVWYLTLAMKKRKIRMRIEQRALHLLDLERNGQYRKFPFV